MDCNQALDLMPGFAVGALTDDCAQLEQHLGSCQVCQQELDDLTSAASLLAESVSTIVVRPEVKLALLERIDNETLSPNIAGNELAYDAKQSWKTYLPYIAATLCAAAVGSWVARSASPPNLNKATDQGISAWQQRIAAAEQALGAPRIQLARLGADASGRGLAVAVFREGLSGEYHVRVSNAAPPSPGQQLWLWLFDRQGVRLTQGPLEYLGQGHAAGILSLPAPNESVPARVAKAILTDEPPGDHATPTGPVVGQIDESGALP